MSTEVYPFEQAPATDPWDVECEPCDWPADTEDDRWVPFDPDDAAAELAHLVAQRPACADLPQTLALLDAHIADARRRAGLEGVPSAEDEEWAALSYADLRPVRGRSAPSNAVTDDDMMILHGCV